MSLHDVQVIWAFLTQLFLLPCQNFSKNLHFWWNLIPKMKYVTHFLKVFKNVYFNTCHSKSSQVTAVDKFEGWHPLKTKFKLVKCGQNMVNVYKVNQSQWAIYVKGGNCLIGLLLGFIWIFIHKKKTSNVLQVKGRGYLAQELLTFC